MAKMTLDERLMKAENTGHTSVIQLNKDSSFYSAFFIEEQGVERGQIVEDSLGTEYKVLSVISKSRIIVERV
ncbi:hypothetical protein Blue_122 [Bacillus phage Deep Blue]|uniref:Uncharacterized protein n=1 Tax=Bacillus phage Deep Blue TaxID=1792245 RepID=A0A140HLT3_9CAUD|nr:hypothetical protein Blue_122 [Bacillus phage Deep Blue]AMO25945.1 hypothetical protein Blue_122 [Bacillus phage Deep Blue]